MESSQYSEDIIHEKKITKRKWIILGAIIILLVVAGIIFRKQLFQSAKAPVVEVAPVVEAPPVAQEAVYHEITTTEGIYYGQIVINGSFVAIINGYVLTTSTTTPLVRVPNTAINQSQIKKIIELSKEDSDILASTTKALLN